VTNQTIIDLKSYVVSDDKICPNRWGDLHKLLVEQARKLNVSEKVPVPLILGGWHASTDAEKRDRLIEQIDFSERHIFLEQVNSFLRSLPEEDWHRCSEERLHATPAMELSVRDWEQKEVVIRDAKKCFAELLNSAKDDIYNEANIGSHMSSFSMIYAEAISDIPGFIQTLQTRLDKYEELKTIIIDGFEENYWVDKIRTTKIDILKLRLLELCREHEAVGGDGIYDFCEDLFLE
jgi:hypothetical protein